MYTLYWSVSLGGEEPKGTSEFSLSYLTRVVGNSSSNRHIGPFLWIRSFFRRRRRLPVYALHIMAHHGLQPRLSPPLPLPALRLLPEHTIQPDHDDSLSLHSIGSQSLKRRQRTTTKRTGSRSPSTPNTPEQDQHQYDPLSPPAQSSLPSEVLLPSQQGPWLTVDREHEQEQERDEVDSAALRLSSSPVRDIDSSPNSHQVSEVRVLRQPFSRVSSFPLTVSFFLSSAFPLWDFVGYETCASPTFTASITDLSYR